MPTCYRHPGREAHIRCQRCERPICPDCMTSASVGFQCPECLKEGSRSQRPLRTTYGGLRPSAPGFVTMVLIAINAAVWLLINVTGASTSRLVDWFALRSDGRCDADRGGFFPNASEGICSRIGGHWVPGVADGAVWQLLTSTFTHVAFLHLFFNCFSLYVLGPQLEHAFGRARFIALYLLSGLAGSALVYWTSDGPGDTLGASGAIFGLMAAVLVIVLRTRMQAQGLLLWVGLSFAYSFIVPNISWQGHLGGFIGGLLVSAAIVLAPRPRRSLVQWGGMGLVAAAIVVAVVARTIQLG
ncbi:rhomboid family intramembrane serine protease [Nocardioides terrae]|uniref:rhomboid family intramembrane serine protease n=1 Tax=Nocardioides terrae TaxID=574651 RepID=UPI001FE07B80|nr:rhomboid family intramembrane serine protease [Nocardioides terrae]